MKWFENVEMLKQILENNKKELEKVKYGSKVWNLLKDESNLIENHLELIEENQEFRDKLNSEDLDNWQLHCKYGEYKKAIDIIVNKRVSIDLLLNSSECFVYNFYAKKQELKELTQQEYDFLKEVLERGK